MSLPWTRSALRVEEEYTEAEIDELKTLAESCGLDLSGLFNNALTVLTWAMGHARAGQDIVAIDDRASKYWVLELPCLTRLKAAHS